MNWNVATFDDLVSFRKILFDIRFSALQPESTKTNVAKKEVTLDILSAFNKYHYETIYSGIFRRKEQ